MSPMIIESTTLDQFLNFHTSYVDQVHGYFAITLCAFGLCANAFNIIVLMQRHMHNAANIMLVGIAIVDALLMMLYVPYAYHYYVAHLNNCDPGKMTLPWVVFTLLYANGSLTLYGISTWLTVALGAFRCFVLTSVSRSKRIGNVNDGLALSLASGILAVLACIPSYVSHGIVWMDVKGECLRNASFHGMMSQHIARQPEVGPSEFSQSHDNVPLRLAYWVHGVGFKLVPCLLMTVTILVLFNFTSKNERRRVRLRRQSSLTPNGMQNQLAVSSQVILMAVLIIFLLTQLPQGILLMITGYVGAQFRSQIYSNLGEIMDVLSLINSSANFFLYCTMSSLYRRTFKNTVLRIWRGVMDFITGSQKRIPLGLTIVGCGGHDGVPVSEV